MSTESTRVTVQHLTTAHAAAIHRQFESSGYAVVPRFFASETTESLRCCVVVVACCVGSVAGSLGHWWCGAVRCGCRCGAVGLYDRVNQCNINNIYLYNYIYI